MKLVKNILRSCAQPMAQLSHGDRVPALAVISIANKIPGLYDAMIIQ